MTIRELIPLKLLIAAAVLLALSFVAPHALASLVPDLQSSTNVILLAIPFLLTFVPIILGFMALIVFVSKILHQRVSEGVYKTIEYVFIAGIVLGIVQVLAGTYFGPSAQLVGGYILILLVLAVRPQGLFSR